MVVNGNFEQLTNSNQLGDVVSALEKIKNDLYYTVDQDQRIASTHYTVLLNILLNNVFDSWYIAFNGNQKQLYIDCFISLRNNTSLNYDTLSTPVNCTFYLDSFITLVNSLLSPTDSSNNTDTNINISNNTSGINNNDNITLRKISNTEQQSTTKTMEYYQFILNILSRFNIYQLLYSLENYGEKRQSNNQIVVELVNSISTIIDRVNNLTFRYKLLSSQLIETPRSSQKVGTIIEYFYEANHYYGVLFDQLVMYLDMVCGSNKKVSIEYLNMFLESFISKLLKIGYKDLVIKLLIPKLLSNYNSSKLKEETIAKTFSNIQGNVLDIFLSLLITNLPNYSKVVYNNLISIFKNLWNTEQSSMTMYILTNKLLTKQSYDKTTQNYYLNLLFNISLHDNNIKTSIYYTCLLNLLKCWSDNYFTSHCTFENHTCISRSILFFIEKMDKELLNQIVQNNSTITQLFLKGIDNHLKVSSSHINTQGMIVAEKISTLLPIANEPLKFDHLGIEDRNSLCLDFSINDSKTIVEKEPKQEELIDPILKKKKEYQEKLEKEFSLYDDPNAIVSLEQNEDEEDQNNDDELVNSGNSRIVELDDDDDDLKPFNLNDDESDLSGKKKMIYLRECLMEIQSGKHTAESWQSALESIKNIVSQKPDDLDELSESLAKSLLHLTNEYGLEDFPNIIHQSLVTLSLNSTDIVSNYLTTSFHQPNFSIGQRIEMLNVLVECANILSNNPNTNQNNNSNNNQANNNILSPKEILIKTQEDTQQKSNIKLVGKVTNRYQYHQPTSKSSTRPNNTNVNRFHSYAAKFFYPFLKGNSGVFSSMDLIGVDSFLLSRLIYSLGVFIECATNSPSTRGMCRELFGYLSSQRYHNQVSVQRAILYSFSRIFYTLPKDIIQSDYQQDEIQELIQWLHDITQNAPDKDSRLMSMGVISTLMENFR